MFFRFSGLNFFRFVELFGFFDQLRCWFVRYQAHNRSMLLVDGFGLDVILDVIPDVVGGNRVQLQRGIEGPHLLEVSLGFDGRHHLSRQFVSNRRKVLLPSEHRVPVIA